MGKSVFFGLLLLLVLAGGIFSWYKIKEKDELKKTHKNLPSIQIPQLNGKLIDLPSSINNNATIVAYFNTTCHLCQSEAQLLVANFQNREDVNFIFIASQDVITIKAFKEEYELDKLENTVFLSDTLFRFANEFKLRSTPYTFVYSSQGQLIEEFSGSFKMQELKDAIIRANGS